MSYRCLDCSYSGKNFANGACPACGSMNIQNQARHENTQSEGGPSRWRLGFAIALWIYLLIEILRKLNA